jgi:hypothetical protein
MRIYLAFFTIVVVAGSLCISFAQSGKNPSTYDPKPESLPQSRSVMPTPYAKPLDAKVVQRAPEPLPQSGSVRECQISFSLKWIEFKDDPTNTEVKKLHEILADDQALGLNPITNRTKEILALTDELLKQSESRRVADHQATLVNGREEQIHNGAAFDLVASEKAGKIIYIAKTENGSFSSAEGDILNRPSVHFVGTSIHATAEIQDENRIKLTIFTQVSTPSTEQSIGGIPGLNKLSISTNTELCSGESLVLMGLRTNHFQQLCVMTPEIVTASDESSKPPTPRK